MRRNKEQSKYGLPYEAMRLCFKRKACVLLEHDAAGSEAAFR